jgi:peptidoglycan hydrolase CwlO-like protein
MLNYLSAISREVGEFRQETNARLDKVEQRLDKIEQRLDKIEGQLDKAENEQRETWKLLNRVAGALLIFRSDIDEVQDRVTALERKQA